MRKIGRKREREGEKGGKIGGGGEKRNRWYSQTILHRVLTVGKSIRDSRFDLYDQIPVGVTIERNGTTEIE